MIELIVEKLTSLKEWILIEKRKIAAVKERLFEECGGMVKEMSVIVVTGKGIIWVLEEILNQK